MKTLIFIVLLKFINGDDYNLSNETEHDPCARDLDIVERGIISNNTRVNMSPRIIGGNAADPGMFPFQAAILIYLDKSVRYYFCGGVLIHPCFILTAAHCCESAKSFQIILGATNFRIKEKTQIRINATFKIIHPGWNNETLENDVCLIKLANCVTYTDYIQPIKIWHKTKADTIGYYATISGWGRTTDKSMSINDQLRYVSLPIIATCGFCQAVYSLVYNRNICTSSDSGMSPCNGDSGGPMVITDDNGTDCLVGIVSYGHKKGCELGFPSVQTYVPCYAKWITKVINYYKPDNDDKCDCDGACV